MTSERSRAMSRFAAVFVSGVLAAGLLAACGGDSKPDSAAKPAATETTAPATTETTAPTETTDTSTQQASADGKQIFTANCASCHTLADAAASGSVGPNLDDRKPDAAKVEKQVKSGGGAMPSFKDQLSAAEITAVAGYVADVAGR